MLTSWLHSSPGASITLVHAIVPMVIIWCLWKARNQARFRGGFVTAHIISRSDEFLHQLGRGMGFKLTHFHGDLDCDWSRYIRWVSITRRVISVWWTKPLYPKMKLNTYASQVNQQRSGGGLLRDHSGSFVFAFCKEFGDVDVLMAEALALLHGLHICYEQGLAPLVLEVDSEDLVCLVESQAGTKWPLCNVLHKIRSLMTSLNSSPRHIFREADSTADKLAGLQG